MNAENIVKENMVGKTVLALEWGCSVYGSKDRPRSLTINKRILDVRFGFNDCREDAGILIKVEDCDEWIFIYPEEEIILST